MSARKYHGGVVDTVVVAERVHNDALELDAFSSPGFKSTTNASECNMGLVACNSPGPYRTITVLPVHQMK